MTQSAANGTTRRDLLRAGAFGFGAVGGATLMPGFAHAEESAPAAIPTDPAFDYYVRVGDVPGESTDAQHKGFIDALAWQWGITSSSSPLGSGGGAGKSVPGDFVFWARSSTASPLLWLAAAEGRKFATAKLDVVRPGDGRYTPLSLTLEQLFVTSYQVVTGDVTGEPIDVVRMDYAKATYTARRQRPDGSIVSVSRGFDFVTNVEI